jgi:hypothetical protein
VPAWSRDFDKSGPSQTNGTGCHRSIAHRWQSLLGNDDAKVGYVARVWACPDHLDGLTAGFP